MTIISLPIPNSVQGPTSPFTQMEKPNVLKSPAESVLKPQLKPCFLWENCTKLKLQLSDVSHCS